MHTPGDQTVAEDSTKASRRLLPTGRSSGVEPILEWIRGAEAHLAALQADHDRVRLLHEQQTAQLDRMQSRVAVLEARVADLERSDTEIAVTVARMQSIDPLP